MDELAVAAAVEAVSVDVDFEGGMSLGDDGEAAHDRAGHPVEPEASSSLPQREIIKIFHFVSDLITMLTPLSK